MHIGARAILGVEVEDQSTAGFGFPFGGRFGGFGGGRSSASTASGVTISGVEANGPADNAGLTAGDTITAIDGQLVTAGEDISSALSSSRPGDRLTVEWVDADGTSHTATVTLEAGPPA